MINFLKHFFKPAPIVYSYSYPKEIVVDKLNDTFKKGSKFFSEVDISGFFTSNEIFEMSTTTSAFTASIFCRSTLIGNIIQVEKESTQIKIKTKPSIILFTLFFICPIIAIIYFFVSVPVNGNNLLDGILAILAGTSATIVINVIIIFISGISTAGVIDRFEMYIDKPLKKESLHFAS